MNTFKFGNGHISEAQAKGIYYLTKLPSAGREKGKYWGARTFSYANAQKVASGERKGSPTDAKSYWTGSKFLLNPDGSKIKVLAISENEATKKAKAITEAEVLKARHGIDEDTVPLHYKMKNKSIFEVWDEWRSMITANNSTESIKTARAYYTTVRFLEIYHPQITQLRNITPNFFNTFKKDNNNTIKSNGKPHSISYLNKTEKRLGSFLKWCKDRNYIDPQLDLGDTIGRKHDKRNGNHRVNGATPFLDHDELERFLEHVVVTPYEFALKEETRILWAHRFMFLAYTGLRSGMELHGLTWGDINFEEREITVSQKIAKNGQARTIAMFGDAKEALQNLQSLAESFPSKETKVIPNSYAALWRCYNFWSKGFLKGSGRASTPHQLRAYFVNFCIHQAGASINQVMSWSGDTLQTLQRHYVQIEQKSAAKEFLLAYDQKSSRKTSFVKGSSSSSVPSKTAEAN